MACALTLQAQNTHRHTTRTHKKVDTHAKDSLAADSLMMPVTPYADSLQVLLDRYQQAGAESMGQNGSRSVNPYYFPLFSVGTLYNGPLQQSFYLNEAAAREQRQSCALTQDARLTTLYGVNEVLAQMYALHPEYFSQTQEQLMEKEGRLPDAVIACVGGGSNAIGAFYNFINDPSVRLIGCEAAGRGVDTAETAATIATGRLGIFHGMKSYFCQDQFGQIAPVYSISAGLDYPGIGPEHAHLHDIGRAEYVPVTDEEAVEAFEYLSRMEGIIPAIESAHAVAYARKLAPTMGKDQIIVVNISGRGDKDCAAIARYRGEDLHE